MKKLISCILLVLFQFTSFNSHADTTGKSLFEVRIDERVVKDAVYEAWKNSFQDKAVNMIKDKLNTMRPYTNRPEVKFSDLYSGLAFTQTTDGMLISLKVDTEVSFLPFSAGMVMKRVRFAGPVELKAYLVMKDGFLNISQPAVDFSSLNLKGLWYLHPSILASIRKAITRELTRQEQNIANQLPLEVPLIPAMDIPLPIDGTSLLVALNNMEYKKPDCPAPLSPEEEKKFARLESGWIVIRFSLAVAQ